MGEDWGRDCRFNVGGVTTETDKWPFFSLTVVISLKEVANSGDVMYHKSDCEGTLLCVFVYG